MKKKEDFSWDSGKIKNGNSLGKIVTIPLQDDSELEPFEDLKIDLENQVDIIVDEFKEKMSEILSRELYRRR